MQQAQIGTADVIGTENPTNDYHQIPATEKQLRFAIKIADRAGITLPEDVRQDRHALSRWIDNNIHASQTAQGSNTPSSKQVAFAERIARFKRRAVPDECFRNRRLMSTWIDHNR